MDTPRDEEDIPGDEQAGDDEPSEEELQALMEAASEQAAEGVSLPAEDDADDEPPTDAGGDISEEDVDADDGAPAAETEDDLPAGASPDEADSEVQAEADHVTA